MPFPAPPLRQTWHQAALFATLHPLAIGASVLFEGLDPRQVKGPSLRGASPDRVKTLAKGPENLEKLTTNPNPIIFRSGSGDESYSRGQWDTSLRAPHSPLRVMIRAVRPFEQPERSGAHGFRSHLLRSLLTMRNFCRIRAKCRYSSRWERSKHRVADSRDTSRRQRVQHARSSGKRSRRSTNGFVTEANGLSAAYVRSC